jgi:predicted nucleic acid-binding protein
MNVIVDTAIWSEALRRKAPNKEFVKTLGELIQEHRAIVLGPIRQELLSGISNKQKFDLIKDKLSFFPDKQILTEDYVLAADYSNQCRKKGIQGSHIDFLICSCSTRLNASIFTSDKDFHNYKTVIPIQLH